MVLSYIQEGLKSPNLNILNNGVSLFIHSPKDNQIKLTIKRRWVGNGLSWGIKWELNSPCVFGYYTIIENFIPVQEPTEENLLRVCQQLLETEKSHLE